MSTDLKSDSGEDFRFSGSGWTYYLCLAQEYGWKPEGTARPKGFSIFKKWHRRYDSNEGQRVSADDAAALADALRIALRDADRAKIAETLAAKITAAVRAATGSRTYELEVQDDDSVYLGEMIAFFRKGRFEIR